MNRIEIGNRNLGIKLEIYHTMMKDKNAKVATLDRLYEDMVKLFIDTQFTCLMNSWLDGNIPDDELPSDLFEMETREYAELQIERNCIAMDERDEQKEAWISACMIAEARLKAQMKKKADGK